MNYLLLPFLFICLSWNAFGQNTDWNALTSYIQQPKQSLRSFKLFQAQYKQQHNSTEAHIASVFLYNRPILNDHLQTVYRISKFEGKQHQHYTLNIISKEDEIIFTELQANDNDSSVLSVQTPAYKASIEALQKGKTFAPDPQHKYFNPSQIILVSFKGNSHSEVKTEADELKALVESKDKAEILQWCSSLSPEIRCYGAVGLYHLKKRGMKLSYQELALLKQIRKEFTLLYIGDACAGERGDGYLESMRSVFNSSIHYFDMEPLKPRA